MNKSMQYCSHRYLIFVCIFQRAALSPAVDFLKYQCGISDKKDENKINIINEINKIKDKPKSKAKTNKRFPNNAMRFDLFT